MTAAVKFHIGTSGYSFDDWVGPFYPPGTRREDMFDCYVRHFSTVELNYTFYGMPSQRTMASLAERTPSDFVFWVKANKRTTHEQDRSAAAEFLDGLQPLIEKGKLGGVLLQFPQGFHRTVANRQYLLSACEDLSPVRLAVEFRHASWDHPSTSSGLDERGIALVVPEVPPIELLFRPAPRITGRCGYLRLHSRDAGKWYQGAASRYDYSFSETELREMAAEWNQLGRQAEGVYVYCNNCHQGQAAKNATQFLQIVEGM